MSQKCSLVKTKVVRLIPTRAVCPCPEPGYSPSPSDPPADDTPLGMTPMFGTALDYLGLYYTEYMSNPDWRAFIATVGFQQGALTSGAQPRWCFYQIVRAHV